MHKFKKPRKLIFFPYHQERNWICCKSSPTLGDGLMLHETCHATYQASDSLPASSIFFLLAVGVKRIHGEGPALFLSPTPFGNPGSLKKYVIYSHVIPVGAD